MKNISKQIEIKSRFHKISANLSASYSTIDWSSSKKVFGWGINFEISGPDFRYNSARVFVGQHQISELLDKMKTAAAVIETVSAANISGDYNETLGSVAELRFKVAKILGKYCLEISASSNTRYLAEYLELPNLRAAIEALSKAASEGEELLGSLQSLIAVKKFSFNAKNEKEARAMAEEEAQRYRNFCIGIKPKLVDYSGCGATKEEALLNAIAKKPSVFKIQGSPVCKVTGDSGLIEESGPSEQKARELALITLSIPGARIVASELLVYPRTKFFGMFGTMGRWKFKWIKDFVISIGCAESVEAILYVLPDD